MLYWANKFTNSVIIYLNIEFESLFSPPRKYLKFKHNPVNVFSNWFTRSIGNFQPYMAPTAWNHGWSGGQRWKTRKIVKSAKTGQCRTLKEPMRKTYPNTWSILCLNDMIWYVNLLQTVTSTLVGRSIVGWLLNISFGSEIVKCAQRLQLRAWSEDLFFHLWERERANVKASMQRE